MSNARKLQTEIDRVLKKVDEGVELFDEIWEKVYSAEQQSQKEKHEQDLKKEIKKLQRLRDQIKTWIGSSEVKDKDALLEARRLIETKMEQFKVCEKETKTKTYSKEGLAREEKLDPLEEAKRNTTGWITDYIERLRQLVQDREVEIERLQAGKGKKSNKLIIDEYQTFLLNHKFHVSKLEGIMRLVNNDRLDPELVDNIKDDLDYYMESYEEDEYQQAYDENFFYESLGLDELDVVVVDRVTVVPPPAVKKASNDDSGSQASSNMSNSKDTSNNNKKSNKKTPAATVIPLTIGRARVTSAGEVKPGSGIPTTIGGPATTTPPTMISTTSAPVLQATASTSAASSPTVLPTGASSATTTPTKLGRASTTGGAVPANAASVLAAPAVLAPATVAPTAGRTTPTSNAPPGASMAAILKRESEQQEKERQKVLQQQQQQALREQQARAAAEQLRQQQQQQQQLAQRQQQEQQQLLQRQQQEALRQQKAAVAAAQQEALQRQQQQEQALRQQQQEAAAKQQAQLQQQVAEKLQQQQQQQQPRSRTVGLDILASGLGGLSLGNTERGEAPSEAAQSVNPNVPPPLAASAPAPTAVTGASLGTSGSYDAASSYLAALNESLATIPNAADSERSRPYTPSNPYPTPTCYPSLPSTMFDNPAVFEKLGTDCLFFIFYYAQGTYQQYLAARELKKQSWRFHKKFMTWFQRHEEPKVTTDEYEQGTYVYFDYESGWCTRIKADFRFEYVYLEDSLQ